jgi:hypothetical protein
MISIIYELELDYIHVPFQIECMVLPSASQIFAICCGLGNEGNGGANGGGHESWDWNREDSEQWMTTCSSCRRDEGSPQPWLPENRMPKPEFYSSLMITIKVIDSLYNAGV